MGPSLLQGMDTTLDIARMSFLKSGKIGKDLCFPKGLQEWTMRV